VRSAAPVFRNDARARAGGRAADRRAEQMDRLLRNGYAPEQAIGRRVDLFIPPEYHELHSAGFNRAVACGCTRNPGECLRLPAMHRTGDRIEIEGSFGIVFDEDGQAVGVAGLLTKAG